MEPCYVYDENNLKLMKNDHPLEVFCDPGYKCCKKGCCRDVIATASVSEPNFWYLLLVALALVIYFCRKGCQQENNEPTTPSPRSYANHYQIQQVQEPDESINRFSPRNPEINLSLVTDQSEDAASQNNTHPITPPPCYEAALLAPSAPIQPQDRIPSYEDVVNSRLYKGHSGPGGGNT